MPPPLNLKAMTVDGPDKWTVQVEMAPWEIQQSFFFFVEVAGPTSLADAWQKAMAVLKQQSRLFQDAKIEVVDSSGAPGPDETGSVELRAVFQSRDGLYVRPESFVDPGLQSRGNAEIDIHFVLPRLDGQLTLAADISTAFSSEGGSWLFSPPARPSD